jgi:hypothetical protein
VAVAEPLFPPLQVTFTVAVMDAVIPPVVVTTATVGMVHPCESVMVQV